MDNLSQDERRKLGDEKHHPWNGGDMPKIKMGGKTVKLPYAKGGKVKGYGGGGKVKLPKMMNRGGRAR